ncbi:hypothetical protein PG990_005585 [Apiospora arundinis]
MILIREYMFIEAAHEGRIGELSGALARLGIPALAFSPRYESVPRRKLAVVDWMEGRKSCKCGRPSPTPKVRIQVGEGSGRDADGKLDHGQTHGKPKKLPEI